MFIGHVHKNVQMEKRKITQEYKTNAARYANLHGITATLKKKEYQGIKSRTLQRWCKQFKAEKPIVDKRGGVFLIYCSLLTVLHFSSITRIVSSMSGDRFYGKRMSVRAEIEIVRRIELLRELGGKISLRTVRLTTLAVLRSLKEEGCLTRMIFS